MTAVGQPVGAGAVAARASSTKHRGHAIRSHSPRLQENENDVDLADKVFRQYGKRWGIETSYRVKKYSFRSKTTSKNYFIRFFYFMFSAIMYNLWILVDIILALFLFGSKQTKRVITSKLFETIFCEAGGG